MLKDSRHILGVSINFSSISLYIKRPITLINGLTPLYEKALQIITPFSPYFTVGIWYLESYLAPIKRQTYCFQIV